MRRPSFVAAAIAACFALVLVGCSSTPAADPTPTSSSTVEPGIEKNITFKSVDGQDLQLDACVSQIDSDTAAPIVVLVHGGAFNSGSHLDLDDLCLDFGAAGFTAFSVEYRFLPDSVFPDQIDDVADSISWIQAPEQIERFNTDPTRTALVGGSAGAILAAQLATKVEGSSFDATSLAGTVLMSGVYGYDNLPAETTGGDLAQLALDYFGCSAVVSCPQLETGAPLDSVSADLSPFLILASQDEFVPVSQAEDFDAALSAAAVPSKLVVVPGEDHSEAIYRFHPDAAAAVIDFLHSVLDQQ